MTDVSVKKGRPVRERLLEEAKFAFAENGYHATRVSDVVRRAGVAQGTFYLYFANKEAVFSELVDRFFERLLEGTLGAHRAEDAAGPEGVVGQVRSMWRAFLEGCREERALVSLVLRESGALGPGFAARVEANHRRVVEGIAGYVAGAAERGLYRPVDPVLAGWALLGMLERAAYYAVLVEGDADLDRLAEDLTRIELGGFLADGSGLS